ncbi:heavy-metal-associated domain-containing protein [Mameliella sp. CS4]|uniref:heavy-metal-associated domain-containing protein n=1 Tax=Mameliella sp. CS4 TaxID=2862329 RepID=UPI001C5FF469|nr:heavy-metal-associated domain-containing protein [Mameliella sp. CS4]MBW4983501.1 heavy-metal-associated domain-containing protein [Mameliella sp. CS4]
MEFNVPDMSCGHCTAAIKKSVNAADPAALVDFDLAERRVRIDSALSPEQLRAAIKGAGYDSQPIAA